MNDHRRVFWYLYTRASSTVRPTYFCRICARSSVASVFDWRQHIRLTIMHESLKLAVIYFNLTYIVLAVGLQPESLDLTYGIVQISISIIYLLFFVKCLRGNFSHFGHFNHY